MCSIYDCAGAQHRSAVMLAVGESCRRQYTQQCTGTSDNSTITCVLLVTAVLCPVLNSMFGGAGSCRRQFGTQKDGVLPSARDALTHLYDETEMPNNIGSLLTERTGRSLFEVWQPTKWGGSSRSEYLLQ